jgi:glycosyltransferase involved in cell wall biosynthesis
MMLRRETTMEIVQVCPLFFPIRGGVESHVFEISKRLASMGENVKIYTTDPSGKLPKKEHVEGFEILRFRSFSPHRVYFFAPELYSAMKRLRNVDVVHVHGYPNFPALAAAAAKNDNNKPLIFTPHYGGYSFHTMGSSILRSLAKRCYHYSVGEYIFEKSDRIITVGKFEKSILKQRFGIDEEKIRYLPNGVNVQQIEMLQKNRKNTSTLLYVGRLEKYKGVQSLLNILPQLKRLTPNVNVKIVGTGSYENELRTLTSSLAVDGDVQFLRNIPQGELMALYASASAFIYLSQYEGLPVALLEAMAFGLPVIATNVGGIPDVVEPKETGFLLNFPPNETELIEYIAHLLNDPELAARTGLKAREKILSEFSWDNIAQSLRVLYEECS